MIAFINLIDSVITLYIWCIIISSVLSWLVAFKVVNTNNQLVYTIGNFLFRITDPLLGPIRRLLPNLGGVDISPVLLIILLIFIKNLIIEILI
ncbi:MAG: hypothetical protein CFH01_00271 [Alphaproteobacteria bacterium MarineAlpha2_Bin1]|nr:MAG: hypothetical protein CFH01_00271 [Alphaproteobacteria bacterium MarineAlpha2_Bin1]|tara:strand:+ start:2450 stop:2728 length:279 start_codon:yes stop_codon:yes gene_type:complete